MSDSDFDDYRSQKNNYTKEIPSNYDMNTRQYDEEERSTGYPGSRESRDNFNNASYDRNPPSDLIRKPSLSLPDNTELCIVCDSKIYPMDKLNADGKLYHKNCFRCSKCRTILSITNFSLNNNAIYCKTHFMELFKLRGKFDDHDNIQHEIITGDNNETIPTADTKVLLAKFRGLESGGSSTPQPCYMDRRNSNLGQRYVQDSDNVVKHDDLPPDDLPPPETAKSMVAKFKAMERTDNIPSPVSVEKMQQKAKANSTQNANIRLQTGTSQRYVNEDDYNKEELPEEGTTRNLLSKFQSLSETN